MFKMMNPSVIPILFILQIQDLSSSLMYTISTSTPSISANSVKNYIVKWTINSSNQVTFYLQVRIFNFLRKKTFWLVVLLHYIM